MPSKLSWEQAVRQLREQPGQASLVRACYYDDPLIEAARRYAESEEWKAAKAFLPTPPGIALDLGAGRGISSYALARDGWKVVALEPDPSELVGTGAIQKLKDEANLSISACEAFGEVLPFKNNVFDLVYGREVLHHASSLEAFCLEAARVLKPGGRFIATREHVISKPGDLKIFLDNHPLHKFYGGENAFLLREYRAAISKSGLKIQYILKPIDSWINGYPFDGNASQYRKTFIVAKIIRWFLKKMPEIFSSHFSKTMKRPGRLYSFVAIKPKYL